MKNIFKLVALLSAILYSATAQPCQPCMSSLSLSESIVESDVVALVYFSEARERPAKDVISLEVLEVLKGDYTKNMMSAYSWNRMCPYGIYLKEGTHIVLLISIEGIYSSVNHRCSVDTLSIEEDKVKVGEESLTIEEFKTRYNLN